MFQIDQSVATIIKWRRWMRNIKKGDMTCVCFNHLDYLKENGIKNLVFRGGKQITRSHGRWSSTNIVARLKKRVLGPFKNAEDVWKASRSAKRGFKLGMGLAELKARMRWDSDRSGAGWYVYRFKRARVITCYELVWLGGADDGRGGEFLENDNGTRFYAPGGKNQPVPPGPPPYGALPGRWRVAHTVRGFPSRRPPLPTIPKRPNAVGSAAFVREVCPAEAWIDLTVDNTEALKALEKVEDVIWELMEAPEASPMLARARQVWEVMEEARDARTLGISRSEAADSEGTLGLEVAHDIWDEILGWRAAPFVDEMLPLVPAADVVLEDEVALVEVEEGL